MRTITAILLAVCTSSAVGAVDFSQVLKIKTDEASDLMKTNFENYIQRAKELAKKQMSQEEVAELTEKAMSIVDDMKNRYINEKLKTQKIVLKYLNGQHFPNLDEHKNNSDTDQKIVKFTIACHNIFNILTKDIVSKIIEKSPLEMVAVIKELSVFLQFASANPGDFGHGVLSEQHNDTVHIFATNDAILRIMKVLVYKNLLRHNKIYKMSRLGTYFYNNDASNIDTAKVNDFVSKLKRSTADNTRVAIYIPEAMLDPSTETPNPSEFQSTVSNYINEINLEKQSKDEADKQIHLNKAVEYAKMLLGVIPNVKVNIYERVSEFCKVLDEKRNELQKQVNSDDKKLSLKAKRDVANYEQIANFLKCEATLLDAINADTKMVELIVRKVPEFVPLMGHEMIFFVRRLETITKSSDAKNFEKTVEDFRNFARQTEEGNCLLSPLLSAAMNAISKSGVLNYSEIISGNDVLNWDTTEYLMIK